MQTLVKKIRTAAGLSQSAAAALANVAPNTWRVFEIAPTAVSNASRGKCDEAVCKLEKLAEERRKLVTPIDQYTK